MSQANNALIIVAEEDLRTQLQKALESDGWQVTAYEAIEPGMDALASAPFILFIGGWQFPNLTGEQLLRRVEKTAPATQRMLVAPAQENTTLIQAVNTARIHACISHPFTPEELLIQARACRDRFQDELEKRQYKRLIKRQNEKLLDLGKKLKRKQDKAQEQIGQAQKRLAQMPPPPKATPGEISIKDISLSSLMEDLDLGITPESIFQLFAAAQHALKGEISALAQNEGVTWDTPELKDLGINFEELLTPDGAESGAIPPPVVNTLRSMVYFTLLTSKEAREITPGVSGIDISNTSKGGLITTFLEVKTDEEKIQATLQTKQLLDPDQVSAADIMEFAQEIGITHGLVTQTEVQRWMATSPAPNSEFILARGKPCLPNTDGEIEYFFEIHYTNPGKILEDGSIDFRDRGDVPFVKAETVLARKTPPKKGEPGINVYGEPIPLPDLYDPPLLAGNGALANEEETEIVAIQDGQPHLDALGSVTVNKDMIIQGDVDFKTGNVNFNGNIIVMGTVKEGFSVTGSSLTTQAVEGAVIELTGDLNVSNGMANTVVKNVANVHAKFINNCKINGFGSINVQKEVVDSNILVSGKCDISKGHIIASTISASQGIEGRIIGTAASAPPILKVGITDHIDALLRTNEEAIQASMEKINTAKEKIADHTQEHQGLQREIAENVQIQENAQAEALAYKKKAATHRQAGNTQDGATALNRMKAHQEQADQAKKEVKNMFERQDILGTEIETLKGSIRDQENQNVQWIQKKRQLDAFIRNNKPLPRLLVYGSILQGVRIFGPNSSLVMEADRSTCSIKEEELEEHQMRYHEMTISGLRG